METLARILGKLRPTIERIGGGGHDGDDLFGEVALACVEKHDRYDWSHPLIKGRIIRIAKNLRIKSLRRERLRKHASLPTDDCFAFAADQATENEHKTLSPTSCAAAVCSLSDPYRHVIHEHFTKGKRLVTIAEELNVPSATIRTRCRRALRQLAQDPRIREFEGDLTQ
jgi:RNA polymerase sigma factor (sigma-70 family)